MPLVGADSLHIELEDTDLIMNAAKHGPKDPLKNDPHFSFEATVQEICEINR